MPRLWLSLSLIGGLLAACSNAAPSDAAPAAKPATPAAPARPSTPPSPYDAQGALRDSGKQAVGVHLPMGLTRVEHTPRGLHAFRSAEVPAEDLIAFFGPRLFTGHIERRGGSVIYVQAVPMDQRDSPVPVDVSITPLGPHTASVKLAERSQPLREPPTERELEKILRQEQKRVE